VSIDTPHFFYFSDLRGSCESFQEWNLSASSWLIGFGVAQVWSGLSRACPSSCGTSLSASLWPWQPPRYAACWPGAGASTSPTCTTASSRLSSGSCCSSPSVWWFSKWSGVRVSYCTEVPLCQRHWVASRRGEVRRVREWRTPTASFSSFVELKAKYDEHFSLFLTVILLLHTVIARC